jgi:hypothetical protein
MNRLFAGLAVAGLCFALAACDRVGGSGPPVRTSDPIAVQPAPSLLAVPVDADLADLSRILERAVPQQLWTIDKPGQTCVKSKGLNLGIATIKTPKLKCRIVGAVRRGPLLLEGNGRDIRIAMPLHATIRAMNVAGILKESATADAMAHAVVRLDVGKDWSLRGKVNITYDWVDSPHVDFLGQRIEFADKADEKLAPIIARLERELPGELDKLHLRATIAQAWRQAFTTVSLNRENPPVWMRVTPRELQYGGYEIVGGKLRLKLGLLALTETYIGQRPQDPVPTPLPNARPLAKTLGQVEFFIPVFADYRELEPVLMRALVKRSARPFDVPGVGPVMARFRSTEIYGTKGGKIAVRVTFEAREAGSASTASGTVWLTGKPVNARDSRRVGFEDLAVTGTTDVTGGDLVIRLINAPGVVQYVAEALTQNFEKDYAKLLGKVDRAIEAKRTGNFVVQADLLRTRSGQLQAAGAGLYLPVWATGTATVRVVGQPGI